MKANTATYSIEQHPEKNIDKVQYTYLMYDKLIEYNDLFQLLVIEDVYMNGWYASFYIACIGPILNTRHIAAKCSKFSYRLIMSTLYQDSLLIIKRGDISCEELATNIYTMLYGLLLHTCLNPVDSYFDVYLKFLISYQNLISPKVKPIFEAIPKIRAKHTVAVGYIEPALPEQFSLYLSFDYGSEDTIITKCQEVNIRAGLDPIYGDIVGVIIDNMRTYKIEIIFNSIYAFMNAYIAYTNTNIRTYEHGTNYIIVKLTKKRGENIRIYDMYINKSVLRGEIGVPNTRSWLFSKYIIIYSEDPEALIRQYDLFSRSMGDYSLLESDISELSK